MNNNGHGKIIIYKTSDNIEIEVKLENNNIWLSTKQLCDLFNITKSTINGHIKNIITDGELNLEDCCSIFKTTQKEGKRTISRDVSFYNLDMIVAIGYRVRNNVGTNFRIWATNVLKEYMIKGFVLNDNLLKEAGGGRYFKELLSRIRDIRSSEKVFWKQVCEIYTTAIDYDPKADSSIEFFKTVQNKMHYAVHGMTAAEVIVDRANSNKDFMGLTSFSGNYPIFEDTTIAKNYLSKEELELLNRIVSLYLDYAELQALEEKTMTMNDYINQLNNFLTMTKKEILEGAGSISHLKALNHAREEYSKFKDRFLDNPTENEKIYLENLKQLFLTEKKNK